MFMNASMQKLSEIGAKMNRLTGVREIMKDIAETLRSDPSKKWLNLSAGNPLVLPEVDSMWREHARGIINSDEFSTIIGRYGMTQGYDDLIDAVVETYNKRYNWGISRRNVLITAGSQSLYFYCTNLWGGKSADGKSYRRVVIPVVPDYTGYDGVVLDNQSLISFRPKINITGNHEFKYGIDLDAIAIDENTAAILCSRPCNPTGNILTNDEITLLSAEACKWDIPLLIDSAYAPPFPNLSFTSCTPIFNDNTIHCTSLSKAGLPGERVGIAIGHERYISLLEPFQANTGIHSSRFGQALAAKALRSGDLERLSEAVIKPFYMQKTLIFKEALENFLPSEINWYLHKNEGALFSWLWIETHEMNDLKLYQKFKSAGLICVPGSSFFPGLRNQWEHTHRCLRFSMTASDSDLVAAAKVIAIELRTHRNL